MKYHFLYQPDKRKQIIVVAYYKHEGLKVEDFHTIYCLEWNNYLYYFFDLN